MADEAAHLRSAAEFVPAVAGDPHNAHFWRQRNDLIRVAVSHIQRIQKALTQMNIQLGNVLSDVSGVTGQAILKAILAGERDPHKLAALRDPRVKASEEQIARYLEGNWQEDLLSLFVNSALPQSWCNLGGDERGKTRARSSSNPARPYIWRLSVFSRLMCPSTGPLLQLCSTAASTALWSCFNARTKRCIL